MRWLKVKREGEEYANCSAKVLYRAIAAGELRAARIGNGRNVIISDTWIDEWLTRSAQRAPIVHPHRDIA